MTRRQHQLEVTRDFVAYVMACAPSRFPYRDYLGPEEQMDLEKSYAELKDNLCKLSEFFSNNEKWERCLVKVEEAYEFYRKNDRPSGLQSIQQAYHLLCAF